MLQWHIAQEPTGTHRGFEVDAAPVMTALNVWIDQLEQGYGSIPPSRSCQSCGLFTPAATAF